ncbi:ABC transporter ATP-binding protein [Yinghuangia soli]|uniref:ABC transporter ATP-binding protein n=1 Tax=Yinghuangia soli TaxID=2908204 RepID=A0AA41Q3I4_9ACTN|nr:ABC transporter ATP-binding protein [Yinghuangia soli]MCF2530888.1 ABC transporter ATP-binding protein [Yinghuangia soli]
MKTDDKRGTPLPGAAPGAAPGADPDTPLLSVRGLRVRYRNAGRPFEAVAGLDLTVHAGETLGLVGESGCGKSTVARAVARIEDDVSGAIVFDGQDVTRARGRALKPYRRRVGMVFQDPIASLNPRRTVRDIIATPLTLAGKGDPAEVRARVGELAELVGLHPSMLERRPHEMSGGQCQRVSIARALACLPELLLCDEVVSALDVSIQAQVLNLLMDIRERQRLAMLFISHDLAVVRQLSDRVAVMYLGMLCEDAPVDELFGRPAHPYTRALLASVPGGAGPGAEPEPGSAGAGSGPAGVASADVAHRLLSGDLPSPLDPPSGCRFRTRCPLAQARCAAEVPQPVEVRPGHRVACHFPLVAA